MPNPILLRPTFILLISILLLPSCQKREVSGSETHFHQPKNSPSPKSSYENWYADSTGLAPLSDSLKENQVIFQLSWWQAFCDTVQVFRLFREAKGPPQLRITGIQGLPRADGTPFAPTKITVDTLLEITEKEWNQVQNQIEGMYLWELGENDYSGFDGENFTWELYHGRDLPGRISGNHRCTSHNSKAHFHSVSRCSPPEGAFRDLCESVLSLVAQKTSHLPCSSLSVR